MQLDLKIALQIRLVSSNFLPHPIYSLLNESSSTSFLLELCVCPILGQSTYLSILLSVLLKGPIPRLYKVI